MIPKHAGMWTGHFKLPLGMMEYVNVCVVLDWCLTPSVPKMDFRLTEDMLHEDNLIKEKICWARMTLLARVRTDLDFGAHRLKKFNANK